MPVPSTLNVSFTDTRRPLGAARYPHRQSSPHFFDFDALKGSDFFFFGLRSSSDSPSLAE